MVVSTLGTKAEADLTLKALAILALIANAFGVTTLDVCCTQG